MAFKIMKHKKIIFFIIGLTVIGVILHFVGTNEIINTLKMADLRFILLAVAVQIFTYYLFAFRWNIINKTVDFNVSIKQLFPIVLAGMAVNNITPSGRIGGEPVKAYMLSKKVNNSFEESFATVIGDRALDTFPFILLAIISIIHIILNISLDMWVLLILIFSVIGISIAFFLLVYISINKKAGKKITTGVVKIIKFFYRKKKSEKLEQKISKAISGFQKTMGLMINDKKIIYYALPLSFFIWFTEIFRVFLAFLAFGKAVDPITISVVFIVASLVGMIPLFPGGVGTIETFMVIIYTATGIPLSLSVSATLIERLISLGMTTIMGFVILTHYGYSGINKKGGINEEKTTQKIINELEYIDEKDGEKN